MGILLRPYHAVVALKNGQIIFSVKLHYTTIFTTVTAYGVSKPYSERKVTTLEQIFMDTWKGDKKNSFSGAEFLVKHQKTPISISVMAQEMLPMNSAPKTTPRNQFL